MLTPRVGMQVVFEDTRARGKPIVMFYGARPFTAGLCAGVEEGMASMRAGGKRIIKVGIVDALCGSCVVSVCLCLLLESAAPYVDMWNR